MASRFVLPFADVGSGISPSDGATLDFFDTGTSTRKDTFSNEALTLANANPVIADGDGVFPDIFMPDGGRYKVTLKDKNGVQIFEADPVVGEVSASLSAKTFDTVAAMVASTELNVGDIVETAGYTTKGDNGQNQYEVVAAATGTDDGGSFIDLATHQAKGLFPLSPTNVKQFGAVGDKVADDTSEIQAAVDFVLITGGEVHIPAGQYIVTSQILVDLTGISQTPIADPKRLNIRGDGKGNTILLQNTDSVNTLVVRGAASPVSHGYFTIGHLAFGGNSSTSRTSNGLRIEDIAYCTVEECTFHNYNVCLVLDGCLSSNFNGLIFNESVKGVFSDASTSGPHANYYSGCEFRQLTSLAYDGLTGMSQGVFIGCQIEGNGTQADSAKGGMHFRLNGAAGEVGPTFIGCYFEVNGGGFDIKVEETASARVAVNVISCNFNRTSSTKFVTNNILTAGDVNLGIQGSTFTSFNTYVPDAGRPYLSLGATTRFTDLGNRWEDAVEGPTISQGIPYAGFVIGSAGAGVTGTLPIGWSVAQTSTGVFTVTHNLGHTDYSVVATADSTLDRTLERTVKATASFQVKTTDLANGASDVDFSFLLTELKPID